MKRLSDFIIESNIETIDTYMINEGIFSWLKKMWKHITGDIDDNLNRNNGSYKNSKETTKAVQNNKVNINFVQCKSETFVKDINKLKSTKEGGPFYESYKFFKTNSDSLIFMIVVEQKQSELVGYLFASKNDNELNVINICPSYGLFSHHVVLNKDSNEVNVPEIDNKLTSSKEYKNIQLDFFKKFIDFVNSNEDYKEIIKKVNKKF